MTLIIIFSPCTGLLSLVAAPICCCLSCYCAPKWVCLLYHLCLLHNLVLGLVLQLLLRFTLVCQCLLSLGSSELGTVLSTWDHLWSREVWSSCSPVCRFQFGFPNLIRHAWAMSPYSSWVAHSCFHLLCTSFWEETWLFPEQCFICKQDFFFFLSLGWHWGETFTNLPCFLFASPISSF